jgi:O-antigen ligase
MNDLAISIKDRWIPWIDRLIEGGILLFIFLFPVKEFIISNDAISLIKWMALYLPFGLWILKMVLRKDSSLVRTPIDRPILLYTIVVVASVFYSIDRIETLAGIRGSYLKAIVLYLVVLNNFQTKEKVKRLAVTFAVSFVVTVGVGFYNYEIGQYNIAGGIIAFENRNHNTMGKILGGSFPFLLLAFSAVKRPIWKGIAILLILLGLFAIFMTLSRATWAGAVFALLIWGMHQNWKKVMTAALILFLFILFSFGPDSVAQRFALLETQISTISDRAPIWEMAFQEFKERPLLGYGYGLNIFEKVYAGRTGQPEEAMKVTHEHNLFFALLIQNGIIGMVLYFWIFIRTLILIYKMILSTAVGSDREVLIVIFSGMIGEYFIHALADRNNVGNLALPLWAMLALAMAVWNRIGQGAPHHSPAHRVESRLVEVK